MAQFQRIVVDVDAMAAEHPALDVALDLAARCGARVAVVDVLGEVPARAREFVTPAIEQELVDDRRRRLDLIAAGARPGVPIETELLRGRSADAVIGFVRKNACDLLIRSHGRDLAPAPRPYGPVDLQLLRDCPCPVWIVDPVRGRRPRRLVAAVDAGAPHAADQELNRRILDLALLVRDVEDASLTVVYAWTPFGESLVRHRLSDQEFRNFVDAAHDAARTDMRALTDAYAGRLTGVSIELLKGEPDEAIPAYMRDHGPDLVVMGTVGRRGLAGALIGNTAERVLRQLHGSVLAVKPSGFVTPSFS